jgi:hypothetical protein
MMPPIREWYNWEHMLLAKVMVEAKSLKIHGKMGTYLTNIQSGLTLKPGECPS